MKNLVIKKGKRTPGITFKTTGELSIKGGSMPENALSFYKPVLEWLEEFKINPSKIVSLTIDLEYMSTSSTRIVLEILRIVNDFTQTEVTVTWVYEEEDLDTKEQGEILQSSIKRPFKFVEKQLI